jgi:hypothetical protein
MATSFHLMDIYTVRCMGDKMNSVSTNMNRGVWQDEMSETIARAIWEGKAIMGTDGSVQDPVATYSFVISISRTDVKPNVRDGGFLPLTAQYLDPYSKRPEAAALLAGHS